LPKCWTQIYYINFEGEQQKFRVTAGDGVKGSRTEWRRQCMLEVIAEVVVVVVVE
jgi:hypothetical protein